MSNKIRLDLLLTERGLQESRQKAQATIMSGLVFVNGQRVDKPGTAVPNDAPIEIRGNTLKYVSRGGLKLEKAMAEFPHWICTAVSAAISAPLPAALRIVCYKTAPVRFTRWMWDTDSLHGNSGRTRGSFVWSGRMLDI